MIIDHKQKGFGSDNHASVHPQVMQALLEANQAHAPSYGTDLWSERALLSFKKHFGPQAEAHFVFNGTAANVTALKAITQSFESVLCSDISHINVDECGAPEVMGGFKLVSLPSQNGKLALNDVKKALIRFGDQHYAQPRVLSLTQPTELGTCYTMNELQDLIQLAHSHNLYVHIDGARLTNACVSLKKTWQEMTSDLGVDVVSFGGTKNGLMMGEAVIFLNPHLGKNYKYIRKQAMNLPSKTRFIAAQFLAYFENNLGYQIAEHSLHQAQKLYAGLKEVRSLQITQPVESNAVFAIIPKSWLKTLREKYFFYVWDEHTYECRLMTSWDTTSEDIEGFIKMVRELDK